LWLQKSLCRSAEAFDLRRSVLEQFLGRGGQPREALDLGRNDDLGALAVGGLGKGLKGLDLDDGVADVGRIEQLERISQRGLRLALGLEDALLLDGLAAQDGRLLLALGGRDGGLLFALGLRRIIARARARLSSAAPSRPESRAAE
jgi:hypothetical protein